MDIFSKLKEKNNLDFNKDELEIIKHKNGPLLVHSTAGSGKTTIICCKVGFLINNFKINPEKILILTYSNACVKDISSRLKELMIGKIHIEDIEKVNIKTIHSFALSVIRYYSYKTNKKFNIIGSKEYGYSQEYIITKIYKDIIGKEPKEIEINRLINAITLVNSNRLDKQINITGISMVNEFSYIYKKYTEYKEEKKLIDFDDMIYVANNLLKENYALRENFQNKYDYILVDEAQDISNIQYEFLKQMVNFMQNIILVGDSDQTIYSFRGSKPNLLEKFTEEFLNTKKVNLSINYRSKKRIVEVSKKFIEKSDDRIKKDIRPANKEDGFIYVKNFVNDEEQNKFVTNEIIKKYKNELDETAIFFRDSLSVVKCVSYLINKNISFYSNSDEFNFFKHFIKNDIIATILLADDRSLIKALGQIYNKLDLGLRKNDIRKINKNRINGEDVFIAFKKLRGFTNNQRAKMMKFEEQLNELSKLKPYDAVEYILEEMRYRNYLEQLSKNIEYKNSIYVRYVNIMKFLTKNEPSIKTYWDWVGRLQKRIKDSKENKGKNSVTLSTLHSAKGLEFKNVFIIDTNEGILPTHASLKNSFLLGNYEEERRLMFVGMTRAKENLYLLSSGKKSSFLNEIEAIIKEIDR